MATEDDRNTSAQRKERAAVLRGCRERVFFLLTVRKYRNWKDHLPEKRQMGQKRPAVVMEPGVCSVCGISTDTAETAGAAAIGPEIEDSGVGRIPLSSFRTSGRKAIPVGTLSPVV